MLEAEFEEEIEETLKIMLQLNKTGQLIMNHTSKILKLSQDLEELESKPAS
jgi:hypothetical protein